MPGAKNIGGALAGGLASRLRFPQLFIFTLVLFILDLLVPDLIPFVDEVLLGLATLLLGNWKTRKDDRQSDQPAMKDITPQRPDTGKPAGE